MNALLINAVAVPLALDSVATDVDVGAHLTRAISGRGLSTRRGPKWWLQGRTVAMKPAAASALEAELRKATIVATGHLVPGAPRTCHVEMRPVAKVACAGGALSVFDFTLREV